VPEDPQVAANGYLMNYDDGGGNHTRVAASPLQFDGEGPSVRTRAPQAGEHTEEILLEAGYSWEDLKSLKERGVIS
jgi:crotonobetainyl-CoA:carnitine CoA-transferase CaiB-like acyl-CoA transferase